LGGLIKLPQGFCDFFGAITSESFWIRAGEVLLGVILLVVGLRMAANRVGAAGGAAGGVTKVATGTVKAAIS